MFTKRLEDIQETDLPLVGGKCLNLGLLIKAGFRVPEGFCITTQAYRRVEQIPGRGAGGIRDARTWSTVKMPQDMIGEILDAYGDLGNEANVAVRSSATAEDLPDASFAGQQDTFLNVRGDQDLLTAIGKCWASLWSERAVAYRRRRGIDDDRVSMAVAVQKMLDPDCSGVMFSVSPVREGQLMIEASWGLGEAIVSGVVTPDSFTVDRYSLQIVERSISSKKTMITKAGELEAPEEKQEVPSLKDQQIVRLARLGLEIETAYSSPQDIEWAVVGDEFYILQSRPITTGKTQDTRRKTQDTRRETIDRIEEGSLESGVLGLVSKSGRVPGSEEFGQANPDPEVERLRRSEISKLQRLAEDTGTVWCAFNLSETLPAPLPMTWAIVSRFMSGRGGFGMTYRDLGFMPGRKVDEKGIVDLICGRAYFNLSTEARLYFDEFPFEHNLDKLKENPANASYPQPTVNIRRSTAKFWLKFPYYVYKMVVADRKMKRIRKDYDSRLKTEIIPEYCKYIENQRKIQLSDLSDAEIISKMEEWKSKTLDDFARDGLKASVLAGMSYSNLQASLTKCFGEDGRGMLEDLIVGLEGDMVVETNQALWEVAHGQLTMDEFLEGYGHRAVGEFELAQPRWREDTAYVESMVSMFREHEELDPGAQFLSQKERREKAEADLQNQLSTGKARAYSKSILREVKYAQRYLPYRETGKFYLIMGYELIRNALLELGRRHLDVVDDIFYLTPDELSRFVVCEDKFERAILHRKIAGRERRRNKLLSIELPDVIFSDSLHEIGNPPPPKSSHELKGTPVSGGVATGEARVFLKLTQDMEGVGTGRKIQDSRPKTQDTRHEIEEAQQELRPPGLESVVLGLGSTSGYILVCPSTDPGWAPLFPGARGLVMERGGILSHGAIVAREYGIPAVANVPGATKLIKDGQRIKVDGDKGKVFV